MTTLREGDFEYTFEDHWLASSYDQWPYYQNHFKDAVTGNKAMDLVAQSPDRTLWLIEIKDYRGHPRTKPIELFDELAIKVRDTLAGVMAAACWHADHPHRDNARKHLTARQIRVVLHLEQPVVSSKLFPRVFDPAKLQQKLRQKVKSIDPHPRVENVESMSGPQNNLPWSVAVV